MKEEATELLEEVAGKCGVLLDKWGRTSNAEDVKLLDWYVDETRQIFIDTIRARDIQEGNEIEADAGEVDLETGPGIAGTPVAKKDPWGKAVDTRGY